MTFEEMEAGLRARLEALPPAARAELVHVLRLPDLDRGERIDEFWGHPATPAFGADRPRRQGGSRLAACGSGVVGGEEPKRLG